VEAQNYLGIYISKDSATVVCVNSQDKSAQVVGCFSVRAEEPADASPHVLTNLISQGCAEREWSFSEVSVALDCAMFMQHNVHSEFGDAKQISATIRFDTEEALATDVSDIAIAFQIASSDQHGSNLTVFTARKKVLSDILISLESSGMDPVSIEPDVNCLSRFVYLKAPADSGQAGMLFGVLSSRSGYLIAPHSNGSQSQRGSSVRTFLVGRTKDRDALLAREAIMTTALAGGETINHLRVFDSAGAMDCQRLGERLGIEAGEVDLGAASGTDEQALADCADSVDFVIAYGAALGHFEKTAVNFRDDYMPYQGKKMRMQKALRFFSVSVTVLLVATGLYYQTRLFSVNNYRGKVRNRFEADYSIVMNGKLPSNIKISDGVKRLTKEKDRLDKNKTGIDADDDTVASKLGRVLEAFNKSVVSTRLNIKTVSISERSISITGDTSSRANTLKFFATIESSGLKIDTQRLDTEPGHDKFTIVVLVQK